MPPATAQEHGVNAPLLRCVFHPRATRNPTGALPLSARDVREADPQLLSMHRVHMPLRLHSRSSRSLHSRALITICPHSGVGYQHDFVRSPELEGNSPEHLSNLPAI